MKEVENNGKNMIRIKENLRRILYLLQMWSKLGMHGAILWKFLKTSL